MVDVFRLRSMGLLDKFGRVKPGVVPSGAGADFGFDRPHGRPDLVLYGLSPL